MKNVKKILALALALCMILSLVPMTVFAEEEVAEQVAEPVAEPVVEQVAEPVAAAEAPLASINSAPVARIEEEEYTSLQAAIDDAFDGAEIEILDDFECDSIVIPAGKFEDDGLTIDFRYYRCTVTGNVGFRILPNNDVTFQNGEINTTDTRILIENQGNLNLANMTVINGSIDYADAVTLSCRNGTIYLFDSTVSASTASGVAIRVVPDADAELDITLNYQVEVEGDIVVDSDEAEFGISLEDGELYGNLVISEEAAALLNDGVHYVNKMDSFSADAPAGFAWQANSNWFDLVVSAEPETPNVAVYNGEEFVAGYDTLAEALNADSTLDGYTVKVMEDLTTSTWVYITDGFKGKTLNIVGVSADTTMTSTGHNFGFYLGDFDASNNPATDEITVTDITMTKSGGNYTTLVDALTGTLNNVTINSDKNTAFTAANGAQVTLENCTFANTGYNKSNTLSWRDAALSAQGIGDGPSVLTVKSGTYTSANGYAAYIFSSGGIINIEDGTFQGKLIAQIDRNTYHEDYNRSIINISGGTFTDVEFITSGAAGYAEINITGGTFDHDPTAYVAEGYAATANGNGTWTVAPVAYVAQIGTAKYETLEAAVDAAEEIGTATTITLLDNVTLTSTVEINWPQTAAANKLTINLNGHDITATDCRALWVKTGYVVIDGTGSVSSVKTPGSTFVNGSSVIRLGSTSAQPKVTVDVNADVTVTSDFCYGVTVFGNNEYANNSYEKFGQTFNLYGTVAVTGEVPAVSGNGNANLTQTLINLKAGSTVSAANDYAVYHPQMGTLSASGTVTGLGGIEMKAGKLTTGANTVITATGVPSHPSVNNNGTSTSGYAVAFVENANYKGYRNSAGSFASSLSNAATYVGKVAVVADNVVDSAKAASVTISKGTFGAIEKGANVLGTIAVSGGTFNNPVPENCCAIGYEPTGADANGKYGVQVAAASGVASITRDGNKTYYLTVTSALSAAQDDETVVLERDVPSAIPSSATAQLTAQKAITLDLNGYTLEHTNGKNALYVKGSTGKIPTLTVTGTGTIKSNTTAIAAGAPAVVTIGENVTVIGNRGIEVGGGNTTLTTSGTITGTEAGIFVAGAGNSYNNKIVNVNGGTISGQYGIYSNHAATVNISDGTITGTKAAVTLNGYQAYGESGNANTIKLNVTGGEIIGSGEGWAIAGSGNEGKGNYEIAISDGTIRADGEAIYHCNDGVLTVTGGSITGTTAIYQKSGTLTVNGGTITGNGAAADYTYNGNGAYSTGDAVVIDNCGYPGGAPSASIRNATISSTNGSQIGYYVYNDSAEGTVLADAQYTLNTNTEKLWSNNSDNLTSATFPYAIGDTAAVIYVAQIGNEKYTTLAAAIAAANVNGGTVTLLGDYDMEANEPGYGYTTSYVAEGETTPRNNMIEIGDNVTLDLNTYTLSNLFNNTFTVTGANVTVENGSMVLGQLYYGSYNSKTGAITHYSTPTYGSYVLFINGAENCTINDLTTTGGINVSGSTATINDLSFSGTSYYSVCSQEGAAVTINGGTYNKAITGAANYLFWVESGSTMNITGGTFLKGNATFKSGVSPVVTGGTFDFDPTAYVAAGYEAVLLESGENAGKWLVGKVETTATTTGDPATDDEVTYTVNTVVMDGDEEIDGTQVQQSVTISGTTEATFEAADANAKGAAELSQFDAEEVANIVSAAVEAAGEDAADVDSIKVVLVGDTAVDNTAEATPSITYEVHPEAIAFKNDEKVGSYAIANDQLKTGTSFTFDLAVPDALVAGANSYVKVTHVSEGYADEVDYYPVEGTAGNYFVTVTVTHFSEFELTPVDVSIEGDCGVSASLTLGDNISINLYVKNLAAGTNAEDYTVSYTFYGENTSSASGLPLGTADANGRYMFRVAECAAKEMIDTVNFKVTYTNPVTHDATVIKNVDYSIRQYCRSQIDDNSDSALTNLCRSVLDYGMRAQYYFGYKVTDLATAGDYGTAAYEIAETTIPTAPVYVEKGDGVSKVSASLTLEYKTQINIYFYNGNASLPVNVTAVNGSDFTYDVTDAGNGRVRVAIKGIAAKDLNDTFQVTLGESHVDYSPLSYMSINDGTDQLGMVCKTLYRYFEAASAYFE